MKVLTNYQAMGDIVKLNKTNPKHMDIGEVKEEKDNDVVQSFADTLNNALKQVNDKQNKADDLANEMIVAPNKVDIHDVMIAAEEAQLSLRFLTQIRDRVIKAYQEIINMR